MKAITTSSTLLTADPGVARARDRKFFVDLHTNDSSYLRSPSMKASAYFEGKNVLITGSGIGKALSETVATFSPAKLVLADIDADAIAALRKYFREHFEAEAPADAEQS